MTQSEKVTHYGDEEIIKELCSCNGVSYEKISQDGSGIVSLEMFFSGFPRMVGLSLFPRLISLTIISQNIQEIQGLDGCPLLQELWVAECQLSEISGLQSCLQLQKLFLYDNKISEIQELEPLLNLHVLWLNSNLIGDIKGLSTLENLKELNLSDNEIQIIGNSLEPNKNLENLNLSGNKVKSFKELTNLAHLPKLRELSLSDPKSTPNPVCVLCNYCTHVLYHLPALHRLDSYDVSAKMIKDAAESIVMKKMMYYNMRVRSIHRQFNETKAKLQQHKKKLQQLPEERIRILGYALQQLETEDESRKFAVLQNDADSCKGDNPEGKNSDPKTKQELKKKQESIRERIKIWEQRLVALEMQFQQDIAMMSKSKEQMVHFVLMELETVGNIRFEEGKTSDAWFTTCYDLLFSRFCIWDYKPYNVSGIKITRILRIHNRALRLHFEDKLHSLLVDELPLLSRDYKRRLEYLFYVFDPETSTKNSEILNILENGFQPVESYMALDRDQAVLFTNSVILCEEPHIRSVQTQAATLGAKSQAEALLSKHGQLIVSKVFLGHSVPVREGVPLNSDSYPKAHSVYCKTSAKQQLTEPEFPSELTSNCDCGQRQALWYIFNHELALPEYLIDFEYIMEERPQSSPLCGPVDTPDDFTTPFHDDQVLDEEVLALDPVLKLRPKLHSLDENSILTLAQANVLSQITVLNLHGSSLTRLKELSHLTTLRYLNISFNELTHLDDISNQPSLECVDASFNKIVTLDGIQRLPRLKQLNLCWNQLSQVREETFVLSKHTPALQRLDTRHNPWSQEVSFRMVVLGHLKTLTHLDSVLVTEEEVTAAAQVNAASKINMMSLLCHSRTDASRPRCLSLLTAAQCLTHFKPSPWKQTTDLEPGWRTKITSLNLDGQQLSCINNLEDLVNLRWASFCHNQLTHIKGLEHCLLLQELSLDHNFICTLKGMRKLRHLTRLSINNNQLQGLDGSVLEHLPNLHFLSAENNCISFLHGVQRSRSLFELYLGNNVINTSRDIYHLKTLINLIILDLYGNPISQWMENYRAYVLFHLPALRALDGFSVDTSESEQAKEIFGGRLTADMVAEKLGHLNYREIVEIELMDCSIRMVDLVPPDLFVNLRSVNLEHNNLTSFGSLVYLPNIKTICLNYNHIESILPRQKGQTHLSGRQQLYNKVHSSGYGQQSKTSRECVCVGSLEPLMSSLEVLHLGYNGISNLCELQLNRLTNLRALYLQGNDIMQVDGLDSLCLLRELVLDQNRVRTLHESWFRSLTRLIELRLNENRLRSLTHLQLPSLQRLYLNNNKLQDVAELEKLSSLPSLVELFVVSNPVARRSLHRPSVVLHLPQLQMLDGVTVTLEERTRAELLCNEYVGTDVLYPGLLCYAPLVRGASLQSVGTQYLPLPGPSESLISTTTEDTHPKNRKQRAGGTHLHSTQGDKHKGMLPHRQYQCLGGLKPPPP